MENGSFVDFFYLFSQNGDVPGRKLLTVLTITRGSQERSQNKQPICVPILQGSRCAGNLISSPCGS